ncbi:MAG: 30S ribosomal protein S12 methylthiotransferase RimO [Clostridiales bacterium]|nr:30S ribosomal protein S12 methylthiotransferase RimO [Clostridiales bacterium]
MGCPKNQADSRQIQGMLAEAGFGFTHEPQEAEVILLNTCGFIDEAKEESIDAILRLAQWKEDGQCRRLVVTGCLVQKYGEELLEAIPEADLFLGVADWDALLGDVRAYAAASSTDTSNLAANSLAANSLAASNADQGAAGQGATDRARRLQAGSPDRDLYRNEWAVAGEETPAGYIKIADGCDHYCTFCVIPQIRGRYRSRTPGSILQEAADRAANGLREAVLVAQDTGAYGRDLEPASSLAELIGGLTAIDGLQRIRVMYCYPEAVDDALIQAMKHPKVCPYLDMPLQHVDDDLLKRMGRPLGAAGLKAVIRRLREAIPGIAIRTTMMVGFPGETEAAFDKMMAFLDEYRLERVGFFAFSPQPGTPAERMPGQIPQETKEQRLAEAMGRQEELMASWHASMVGKTIEVCIDGEAGRDGAAIHYEGRSRWDAPEIDGIVCFSSALRFAPGQTVQIKITHSRDYLLFGEIHDESSQ